MTTNEVPKIRGERFDIRPFINALDIKDGVMIEIGVYAGEGTEEFAKSGKFNTIYAIDPFLNGYHDEDPTSYEVEFSKVENVFDEMAKNYKEIMKLKITSAKAVSYFPYKYFDLVYIDAIHTYDAVKEDIKIWLPKVKDGGIIAGHDYGEFWPGVKMAVDEILGAPHEVFVDDSWMVIV